MLSVIDSTTCTEAILHGRYSQHLYVTCCLRDTMEKKLSNFSQIETSVWLSDSFISIILSKTSSKITQKFSK